MHRMQNCLILIHSSACVQVNYPIYRWFDNNRLLVIFAISYYYNVYTCKGIRTPKHTSIYTQYGIWIPIIIFFSENYYKYSWVYVWFIVPIRFNLLLHGTNKQINFYVDGIKRNVLLVSDARIFRFIFSKQYRTTFTCLLY